MTRKNFPNCVYRLYDGNGSLIYVGQSANVRRRLTDHARNSPWWDEVARQEVEEYTTRSAALAAEAATIESERPRYNIARGGGGRPSVGPMISFRMPKDLNVRLTIHAQRTGTTKSDLIRRAAELLLARESNA